MIMSNVFEIHVSTAGREPYKLSALTPAERDDWVRAITAATAGDYSPAAPVLHAAVPRATSHLSAPRDAPTRATEGRSKPAAQDLRSSLLTQQLTTAKQQNFSNSEPVTQDLRSSLLTQQLTNEQQNFSNSEPATQDLRSSLLTQQLTAEQQNFSNPVANDPVDFRQTVYMGTTASTDSAPGRQTTSARFVTDDVSDSI